jgi:hypothetical protein
VDTLLTQAGTSAGLIGRFSKRGPDGRFDGYLFDVSAAGAWKLIKNDVTARKVVTLAAGLLHGALGTGTWHRLSMAMVTPTSGTATVTVAVDGQQVASVTDRSSPWTSGLAGIEAGASTGTWPQAQYSNLAIMP